MSRRRSRQLLLVCVSAGAAVTVAACGSGGGGVVKTSPSASKSAKPAANASNGGINGTGTGTGANGTNGGGGTGGGGTGGGGVTLNFTLTSPPMCPAGTNLDPIPGSPAVVSWTSTGTTGVTLAVDGPGAFGMFGPNGSETLSFPCSGAPNTTQTHTYVLTTNTGGVSRTIVASAKVNEIANVGSAPMGGGGGGPTGGPTAAPSS